MTWIAFAVILGATGLMRIGEVIVSKRRIDARPDALVPEPALFPLMVALHVGFIVLPLVEVVVLGRPFVVPLAVAAGAVLGLATALRIWTLSALGASWNVRVLPPKSVVTSGPYHYIRHPNYLVVILEIASLPLLHGAWASAVSLSLFNAVVLTRRIRTEEDALSQLPAWREAMDDKARLVPGIF